MRRYSQLVFRDVPPASGQLRATLIVVHGADGGIDDVLPLAQRLGPNLRILAPEAARGVYLGIERVAHTWYGGHRPMAPEPASFGDSLAQLERFVCDVIDRRQPGESEDIFLLGYDQGAVLALALAGIIPDLLAGVMAVGGCLPTFRDPDLVPLVESTLPVLLISDSTSTDLPATCVNATAASLGSAGAKVSTRWIEGAHDLKSPVADMLRTWLNDQLGR